MPAAIHVDDLSGDGFGSFDQEQGRLADLIQCDPAGDGCIRQDLFGCAAIRGRQDGAQGQGVDADARGEGDSQRTRQGSQGSLRDGVGQVVGARAQRAPVQDVEDAPLLIGRQQLAESPG